MMGERRKCALPQVSPEPLFVLFSPASQKRNVPFAVCETDVLQNGADVAGGGSRIRTGDFLLAKQALYQLSYAPESGNR